MRGNDSSRDRERKKGLRRRKKERKKEKSIDRVKREKKISRSKFPLRSSPFLRFSREREERGQKTRSPSALVVANEVDFLKKEKLTSLSPCTRLAPKSLCARSSASPASSTLKRRCSCLVPTPAPSPKRWPRTVESFPRWRCFCVA